MTPTIVVAGGGPAGIAAAVAAGRAGASVVLLEEREAVGGQLRYRVQPIAAFAAGDPEPPRQIADRLADDAHAARVEVRTGAVVAGWFPGNELLVVEAGRSARIVADALIVATGSTDLPYPFPGATFPGVFSARGLQTLLNVHRVRPGRRVAVIGAGVDAEDVINDVLLAGGEVVWSGIAPASFLRAEGADGVTGLVVGRDRFEVDVVAIAVGRQPDSALATMAGVPIGFSSELGGPTPLVDDRLAAQVPGIFVAGDAAGIGSVAAAIAEGHLAGVAAAVSLGLGDESATARAVAARGPELVWRSERRRLLTPTFVQPYE